MVIIKSLGSVWVSGSQGTRVFRESGLKGLRMYGFWYIRDIWYMGIMFKGKMDRVSCYSRNKVNGP